MKTPILPKLTMVSVGVPLAIAVGSLAPRPILAQSLPASAFNGLSYPTESQRFFQRGVERFEVEIRNLQQQRLQSPEPVLVIDRLSFAAQYQIWQKQQQQQRSDREVRYRLLDREP